MASRKEKIRDVMLKELGDVPGRISNARDFFDRLNNIVHYYLERFGPYVSMDKRSKLTKLSLEADKIYLELEALNYEITNIEAILKAYSKVKKKYKIPEKEKKKLKEKTEEICKSVSEFQKKVIEEIEELIKIVERKGVD